MGYQTLYRKYRSQTFSEVVGQTHVLRVLRGALSRERVAHAYLFSGPRGTGKTSVARIFAKALNCPHAKEGEPCGACHVCTSIAEGRSPDVIEMDAASNRGVESIEELRRGVQFVPHELKHKVYIIDEVHMISNAGFNALLKTLEEPPSHAIFILATTEPQKLPITILSRCLRFDFHRLPYRALADHLIKIASAEGQKLRDDVAIYLAELAEGSARDAISLLDQLIIAAESEITQTLVRELFGLSHPKSVIELIRELVGGNLPALVEKFHEAVREGKDPEYFLELMYGNLRDGYLRDSEDDELLLLLGDVDQDRLLLTIESIWDALGLIKRSNHPIGLVELTLFKLAAILHGGRIAGLSDVEREIEEYAPVREGASGGGGRAPEAPEREADYEAPVDGEAPVADAVSPPPRAAPASSGKMGVSSLREALKKGPEHTETQKTPGAATGVGPKQGGRPAGEQARPSGDSDRPFEGGGQPSAEPASEPGPPEATSLPGDSSIPPEQAESERIPLPPHDEDEDEQYIPVPEDYEGGGEDDLPIDEGGVYKARGKTEGGRKKRTEPRARSVPAGFDPVPPDKWRKILSGLKKNYLSTFCLVHEGIGVVPVILRPGVLYVAFPIDKNLLRGFCREGRHRRALEVIATEVLGLPPLKESAARAGETEAGTAAPEAGDAASATASAASASGPDSLARRAAERSRSWQIVFDPGELPDPDADDLALATQRAAQLELLFGANGNGKDDSA